MFFPFNNFKTISVNISGSGTLYTATSNCLAWFIPTSFSGTNTRYLNLGSNPSGFGVSPGSGAFFKIVDFDPGISTIYGIAFNNTTPIKSGDTIEYVVGTSLVGVLYVAEHPATA